MPISCAIEPVGTTRDEYHQLDYEVMALAFETHGHLGRLHDEDIYQAELALRCVEAGMVAQTEVPIVVSFDSFRKTYFMDLVIERKVVYELKTVRSFSETHKAQLLNYLLLVRLERGKLVNFRPPSVKSYFVTTSLTTPDRYGVAIEDDDWDANKPRSNELVEALRAIVDDWGGFLDLNLYREALCHLLGGEAGLNRLLEIHFRGRSLGEESMLMLDDDTALELSALRDSLSPYTSHLRRKYEHTDVKCVQWINFEGHIITIKTLRL